MFRSHKLLVSEDQERKWYVVSYDCLFVNKNCCLIVYVQYSEIIITLHYWKWFLKIICSVFRSWVGSKNWANYPTRANCLVSVWILHACDQPIVEITDVLLTYLKYGTPKMYARTGNVFKVVLKYRSASGSLLSIADVDLLLFGFTCWSFWVVVSLVSL